MKEFRYGGWLLAAGGWLLAVGYWQLAAGGWRLAKPCKELVVSKRKPA